jgi:hypothetical protein
MARTPPETEPPLAPTPLESDEEERDGKGDEKDGAVEVDEAFSVDSALASPPSSSDASRSSKSSRKLSARDMFLSRPHPNKN